MENKVPIISVLNEFRRIMRSAEVDELEALVPGDMFDMAVDAAGKKGDIPIRELDAVREMTFSLLVDTASANLSETLKQMIASDEVLERYFIEFGRQGFLSMVANIIGQVVNA